jgi:hypothetical protein
MIKINMEMPDCCMKCLFYRGSHSGGKCAVDDDLYFGNTYADIDIHDYCPLQEVEDDD